MLELMPMTVPHKINTNYAIQLCVETNNEFEILPLRIIAGFQKIMFQSDMAY